MGTFVATFMSLVGVVGIYYPDKPSVHRGFEGGLDRELGGESAMLVSGRFGSPDCGARRKGYELIFVQARTEDGMD